MRWCPLPLCSFLLFKRRERLDDSGIFCPCTHQKSTKALLKWRPGNNPGVRPGGGHHLQALCSCQEPFTPSRFSPNGTSESIKTIITAIPESKEIILDCQEKDGKGFWRYLVRNLLDMHLARQPITASCVFVLFCFAFFFLVWTLCSLLYWTHSQTTIVPECRWCFLNGFGGLGVGNRNLCVGWGADVINNCVFTPTIA